MSNIKKNLEVAAEELQYHLDEKEYSGSVFEDAEPCCGIIGQNRALAAVELGLDIKSAGYNIFVTGLSGTGRTTAVKLLLEGVQDHDEPSLQDICFVNNFKMAESPRVLYFPAGEGRKFKKAIGYLIDSLVTVIPKIFSGESYREKRQRVIKEFEAQQKELFKNFELKLKEKGFVLVQLQFGPAVRPDLQPVINGEAVSWHDLEKAVEENKMPADALEKIKAEYEELFRELQSTSTNSQKISGKLEEELNKLDTSIVVPLINEKIETLKNIYDDPKTQNYLVDLNEILIEDLDAFRPSNDEEESERNGSSRVRGLFSQFTVNLLVDNGGERKKPIIIEDFPNYKNLFGSIEKVYEQTTGWHSDFTRIRGGSILKANGGYLVINAIDLFQDPYVWPALKRTLRTGRLVITNIDTFPMSGTGLKPEPVNIDVKVILIGDSRVYDVLFRGDDEFKKVFKIKAEFDSVMENDHTGVCQYTQFVKKITSEDELLPFDHSGLAAIAEYGVKLAGRKDRLSTRFTNIADLVRESAWLAGKEGKTHVNRDLVKRTREMQVNRVNLIESKIQEMYERDIYLIDVTGSKVGMINGLSVYDLGEHAFGRPARITASLSPGADGVINIEREAAMSGRTHDKGVLILSGFMRHRFGRKRPLVFSASLCFEQSYGGVDGDSASSTEIYALLSALSGKPINQALAVTGSVNQKGEIQPIGGINEKIEGFFDVCMIDGLTGEQGVLMPIQNKQDLMLKDQVVDAVREGKFHIYAVKHIDEGLELLTGCPAGEMQEDGSFPEGSINYLADKKLEELAGIWREYLTYRGR